MRIIPYITAVTCLFVCTASFADRGLQQGTGQGRREAVHRPLPVMSRQEVLSTGPETMGRTIAQYFVYGHEHVDAGEQSRVSERKGKRRYTRLHLSEKENVDILAYILSLSRYAPGEAELDYQNGALDEITVAARQRN